MSTKHTVIYSVMDRKTGTVILDNHEVVIDVPDNRLPMEFARSILRRGMGLQKIMIIHDIYFAE